jgi:3-phosphoshikimate 1-carboxyvinyltransferase
MDRAITPARRLRGTVRVPGDKSISHRAAIFNALAGGEAVVQNFLPGDDCRSTLRVLTALGADVALDESGEAPVLRVRGAGLHGLREPHEVLDCGNSGTTIRLMAGVLAGQPFHSVLSGDASLRTRPMGRIAEPLRLMGGRVDGRMDGGYAPLSVRGGGLRGIRYRLPVASAQTKSAVLLAALFADGDTVVEEPAASRDHTERMLSAMGARVDREGPAVRLQPGSPLQAMSMRVPNDISAAAFWMVAAAVHPDAEIRIEGVGVNPTRAGVIDVLREMGADVAVDEERTVGGEPVADVTVRSSRLTGVVINGDTIPRLIDEVPVLAVAAALANGTTRIRDAGELRVKESDRIATVASELRKLGARIEEHDDGMTIEGGGALIGADVDSGGDHRLAMALAIAALCARGETRLSDAGAVAISYPDFWGCLERLTGDDGGR